MLRTLKLFVAVATLTAVVPGGTAMASPTIRRAERIIVRDTVRAPYMPGKVYEVRLMPGAPFALELPAGESARNIWVDNRWWKAESTLGSSRVFVLASARIRVFLVPILERLASPASSPREWNPETGWTHA